MKTRIVKLLSRVAERGVRRGLDLREQIDGRQVRLTDRLDAESEAFEAELLAGGREPIEVGDPRRDLYLPIFQRHLWLRSVSKEMRLFQLRDRDGRAAMQAAMWIDRPRRAQVFGRAIANKLGTASSGVEEEAGLAALHAVTQRCGDLLTLRLQPYRRTLRDLLDFESRARRAGFRLVDPFGPTRTLLYDVSAPIGDLLAALTKKTRAKVRHRERQNVEIRALTDPALIPRCAEAVNASLARHGGGVTRYDFAPAFALAASRPDLARVLGLFLPGRDELLAYVIGIRHGELVEYSSAGSIGDPRLRALPFNYWLLWELVEWAKSGDARWLDLGGVTDGGPGDVRAGISDFKRKFTDHDVELGRELEATLHPVRAAAVDALLRWRNAP